MEVVRIKGQGGQLGVGDPHAGGVPVRVVGGLHCETRLAGGGGDELDDGEQGRERTTPPLLYLVSTLIAGWRRR